MQKTFKLLAKLSLEKLNRLEEPESDPELQAFLKQLESDYTKYIHVKDFDPLKRAENWLREVRALAEKSLSGIDEESLQKIDRISVLYNGMGDHAFRLLDMYQTIDTLRPEAEEMSEKRIKTAVEEYRAHLAEKIKEENIVIPTDGRDTSNEMSPKQQKLVKRYETISELSERIKDKPRLDESDQQAAKKALDTCLKNKPEWSEEPFLRKLTDVLSFGLTALYREFVSKETELKGGVEQELSNLGPKPGG